jgi:DNA-binding NarL/FixJ family response regulator
MTCPTPLRILLVDDHALFRKAIISLLGEAAEFSVVGEAATGQEALEQARKLQPDLILMDLSMPEMDGLEATRRIKAENPEVRIVILTIEEEDQNLFEAVKSGAQGYLLKKVEPAVLYDTLRRVSRGEASLSGVMAARLMEEFMRQAGQRDQTGPQATDLSGREREVLALVAQGKSNKEIAAAMVIAENTVKNHLKSILEKLHLQNRVQAATYALRQGLVGQGK